MKIKVAALAALVAAALGLYVLESQRLAWTIQPTAGEASGVPASKQAAASPVGSRQERAAAWRGR